MMIYSSPRIMTSSLVDPMNKLPSFQSPSTIPVDNRHMKRWKKRCLREDIDCFGCHRTATHTPLSPLFLGKYPSLPLFLHFSQKSVCVFSHSGVCCGIRLIFLHLYHLRSDWKVLWDFHTLSTIFMDITKDFITDKLITSF
jgi:hypothetical protein